MTELTISLPDKDYLRAKDAANRTGKSIEMLIRELISRIPESKEKTDISRDPLFLFEGFESDAPPDLSMNADKYLYEKGKLMDLK